MIMSLRFLALATCLILSVSMVSAQSYDFSVRENSCGDREVSLLSMYDTEGGNVAEPGYYKWQVCASGVAETDFARDCSADTSPIAYLAKKNNSHIFTTDQRDWKVCAGFSASINNSCQQDNIILSTAKENDSHAGDPGALQNKLCASDREVETVSLEMSIPEGNSIVSDGQTVSSGYSADTLDYPALTTADPAGIVSYGDFQSVSYENVGSRDKLRMTQSDGSFIVPNTEGGFSDLEDDQEDVDSREFLGRISPSFTEPEPEQQDVRVIYSPDIELQGFEGDAASSDLYVRNTVNDQSETAIDIGLR